MRWGESRRLPILVLADMVMMQLAAQAQCRARTSIGGRVSEEQGEVLIVMTM
jgi:hypothetical protein